MKAIIYGNFSSCNKLNRLYHEYLSFYQTVSRKNCIADDKVIKTIKQITMIKIFYQKV